MHSTSSPIHTFSKMAHSPYSTPVLAPKDVSEANKPFYASFRDDDDSESSSLDCSYMPPSIVANQRQPLSINTDEESEGSANHFAEDQPSIPPPSYMQATTSLSPHSRKSTPPAEPMTPLQRTNSRRVSYSIPVVAPEGSVHINLAGQVDFIQPPSIAPVDHPSPNFPCYRLFLGQIRFETTSGEIRWLIRHISGVSALKIEPRGTGCFLAYFRTFEELMQVKMLHKRILFDRTGIWYARTPAQTDLMHYYVENVLQHAGRSFRLPKDMMVVEEEKLSKAMQHYLYQQQFTTAAPPYVAASPNHGEF